MDRYICLRYYGVPQTANELIFQAKPYTWIHIPGQRNTFQTPAADGCVDSRQSRPTSSSVSFFGNNLLWFKMGLASDTTQYDYSRYVDYDTQPSPEYLLYVSTGGSLIPIYFEGQTDNITDSPFLLIQSR